MNRVEWEVVLEKKGRGRGLSYFYRPWVYRKFILRSNQTLDYYDLIHLHWKGSISLRGATVQPVAGTAAELANEKKPFPFVIFTEESESIYLNAESEAIRQQAISIFQEAAKRRFPSLPSVAAGGNSLSNQHNLPEAQKEAVVSIAHERMPYRSVPSLTSSCIVLESGETYVPSIRTSLIVYQSEMERAYYEVGVPEVVGSSVSFPAASELIPIISALPVLQREKRENPGKADVEIMGREEMDIEEEEEHHSFQKEEAENGGEEGREWQKEVQDLKALKNQEETGGGGNDESLDSPVSSTVAAISSLTEIPADTIDLSKVDETISSTLPFPKYGIPLSHVDTVIEQCGGRRALEGLSTTDVCLNFIRPWTASKQCSYCEYLKEQSPDLVQTATVFVSHAWKYKFLDVMDSVKDHFDMIAEESADGDEIVKPVDAEVQETSTIENIEEDAMKPKRKQQNQFDKVIIWFDLFSNNQHKAVDLDFNWWCTTFKSAIEEFNHTLLVLSPWEDPIPLTRAWCLFEIYCTAQNKNVRFDIAMSKTEKTSFIECMLSEIAVERMDALFTTINLERSEATNPLDRDRIFEVVKATIGFNEVNKIVLEKLRNWILQTAEQKLQLSSSTAEHLSIQQLLGVIYRYQGKYNEGEKILQTCLHSRKRYYGEKHRLTYQTQFELSVSLNENGKYQQAEQLASSCLLLQQELNPNEGHDETLKTLNLLGLIFLRSGQLNKALEILQDCFKKRQQYNGESHAETFRVQMNLATALLQFGDLNQAEQLILTILQHENTINNKNHIKAYELKLTDVYIAKEEFEKAEQYIKLDYFRSVFGENHPNTLILIGVTGYIRQLQGRYNEAEALYLSLLEKYTNVYGEYYPETLNILNSLGCFYMLQRRDLKQAELYLNKAYEGRKQVFGENNLEVLNTLMNIATLQSHQGRFMEALKTFHTCLGGYIPIYGDQSVVMLPILTNIASTVFKLGKMDLAEKYSLQSYHLHRLHYTENHSKTIQAMGNLGILYRSIGSPESLLKAEELFLKILKKVQNNEILGGMKDDHPTILMIYHQLGTLYMQQNQYDQSIDYLLLCLSGRRKVLGDNHIDTMEIMYALGVMYNLSGRKLEAKQYFEESVKWRAEVLGEEHPSTISSRNAVASIVNEDLSTTNEEKKST